MAPRLGSLVARRATAAGGAAFHPRSRQDQPGCGSQAVAWPGMLLVQVSSEGLLQLAVGGLCAQAASLNLVVPVALLSCRQPSPPSLSPPLCMGAPAALPAAIRFQQPIRAEPALPHWHQGADATALPAFITALPAVASKGIAEKSWLETIKGSVPLGFVPEPGLGRAAINGLEKQ